MVHLAMYSTYIMKRTQIYLDDAQDARLAARAGAAGQTKSHLIRVAIDRYLNGKTADDGQVEQFRAAVKAGAGIAPYLPDGAQYVAELRGGDSRRQEALDEHWRR